MPDASAIVQKYISVALSIFVAAGLLAGCAVNQTTGKRQLSLVKEEVVISQAKNSFLAIHKKYQSKGQILVSPNDMDRRVVSILNRLIDQAVMFRPEAAKWPWQVVVIDEKDVNAFCFPGGQIGVYRGLIDKLQLNDDELALVLGHEIAHAIANHGSESYATSIAINLSLALVNIALQTGKPGYEELIVPALALGSNVAFKLPESRAAERQADALGLEVVAMAGFDLNKAVKVWPKMSALGGAGHNQLTFLSTHPSSHERHQQLLALIPEAEAIQQTYSSLKNIEANPWIKRGFNEHLPFDPESRMQYGPMHSALLR
jgi:Zn-dependent protease with chaperone function